MKTRIFISKLTRIKTLFSFIFLLSFFVYFVAASDFKIQAPATIYKGCVQPYIVQMDTDGIETKSIDSRFFLTGYFSIEDSYVDFDQAISANTYANYFKGSAFDNLSIQTGTATSGLLYQGWEYLYLNSWQNFNSLDVTGDNKNIATLYFKANNFDTGHIDFYYITGRNGDDSNISSGLNAGIGGGYTSYTDALSGIVNLDQAFSSANTCDSKPYISIAKYRQTGYISTSTGVQAILTSVVAGPLYSGDTSRTLWTRGDVKLFITGVSDTYANDGGLVFDTLSTGIKINNTLVSAFSDDYISRIDTNTGWMHQYYEVLITGNTSTGFVGFENILGNTGNTYTTGGNNYSDIFNIDVFWIDTIVPTMTGYFTGYISASGGVTTIYTLSGSNYNGAVSNPANGFHANWTDKDDQYKVISFSGTNSINANCNDIGYACTITGYMDYLNTTGYVRSGSNIFKLEHSIIFTNSFSGIVVVMDRAGNTGEWQINIDMDSEIIVGYGLIAQPQLGVERNQLVGRSGMLMKLAIYSGGFDKHRLLGSGGANIELVYTGWIKTSSTGYTSFTGNFSSGSYWVLIEGVNTLSYLMSGVSLTPIGGLIDYTQVYNSGFLFGDIYSISTTLGSKHATYMSDGSNRDEILNTTDLARLVIVWGEFGTMNSNSAIGVYSGEYFVDKPSSGTGTKILSSLLQTDAYTEEFMQYHPYDINANGKVNNIDYSEMLQNLGENGATYGGALDGVNVATMPF